MRFYEYISTNYIEIKNGKDHYIPNYPLPHGIGFAVKKTFVKLKVGYSILPLKSKEK